MISSNTKAYENVRAQIGYCGIWCGSCVVGNGALRELAARFESILDDYGVEKWGPKDFDWQEFSKGLAAMKQLPLCPGCWKGGGRDNCPIRACAKDKGLDDCTLCGEQSGCRNGTLLGHMRSGAVAAGLSVRNAEPDRNGFLAESEAQLRNRWPSCILCIDWRRTPANPITASHDDAG